MNLNELALLEERILAQVRGIKGTIQEKHVLLERSGIFNRYRCIYNAYVDLALQGNLEALKRALFLRWFEVAEPSFLTGIAQLDGDRSWRVLEYLEVLASTNKLDTELRWMLPYYYTIADYYFDSVLENSLPALRRFLDENKDTSLPCKELLSTTLDCRGQMADYWLSMRKHCEKVV